MGKQKEINMGRRWTLLATLVLFMSLVLLGGCGKSESSAAVSKKISIVKQAKASGVYVWETADGYSKDSIVDKIIVFRNGVGSTYRMNDNNITLGKLSSMNDNQIIDLAKNQDKKSLEYVPKNIKNALNGKDGIGQYDWSSIVTKTIPYIAYVYKGDSTETPTDAELSTMKFLNNKGFKKYDSIEQRNESENSEVRYSVSDREMSAFYYNRDTQNKQFVEYWNAIKKHAENTKYKEPTKFKLKKTSNTDETGNHITDQKITIDVNKNIDSDFLDSQNAKFYKMVKNDPILNKKLMDRNKQLIKLSFAGTDYESDLRREEAKKENVGKLFSDKFVKDLTDGVIVHDYSEYEYHIVQTTAFDIYKARYIGYERSNGEYLVTKAQNKTQKAVFSK